MSELAIGVVIGIGLAALVTWLTMREWSQGVDEAMRRAARTQFGKEE